MASACLSRRPWLSCRNALSATAGCRLLLWTATPELAGACGSLCHLAGDHPDMHCYLYMLTHTLTHLLQQKAPAMLQLWTQAGPKAHD